VVLLPKDDKVRLLVNGDLIAEAGYNLKLSLISTGQLNIGGSSSRVLFDWVDVRIGGSE
jgi:hypothetical protein